MIIPDNSKDNLIDIVCHESIRKLLSNNCCPTCKLSLKTAPPQHHYICSSIACPINLTIETDFEENEIMTFSTLYIIIIVNGKEYELQFDFVSYTTLCYFLSDGYSYDVFQFDFIPDDLKLYPAYLQQKLKLWLTYI